MSARVLYNLTISEIDLILKLNAQMDCATKLQQQSSRGGRTVLHAGSKINTDQFFLIYIYKINLMLADTLKKIIKWLIKVKIKPTFTIFSEKCLQWDLILSIGKLFKYLVKRNRMEVWLKITRTLWRNNNK